MAKVITICNQKGGVAKTTTAVNISGFLAMSGKKILLIDIDPQANATSGLGIDKLSIEKSVYNVFIGQLKIEEVIIPTQVENLYLAPSSINLTGAELELVSEMAREFKLKQALVSIINTYDYIIIDCPPSLGLLTINGLCASDSIIIPIQCEYYALEGLGQLINTVNLVKNNLNKSLEIEGIVMTMADFRTRLTQEVIDEVGKFIKDKVYRTVIPRCVKLSEAPGFGKPIMLYDKNCSGSVSYFKLTQEILGIRDGTIDSRPKTIDQNIEKITTAETAQKNN